MQLRIAVVGAYSAEDAGKTLVTRVESSAFPNRVGAGQRRALTLNGDELTRTPLGSHVAALAMRRAKWNTSTFGRTRC